MFTHTYHARHGRRRRGAQAQCFTYLVVGTGTGAVDFAEGSGVEVCSYIVCCVGVRREVHTSNLVEEGIDDKAPRTGGRLDIGSAGDLPWTFHERFDRTRCILICGSATLRGTLFVEFPCRFALFLLFLDLFLSWAFGLRSVSFRPEG